jgi:hypothetical protein
MPISFSGCSAIHDSADNDAVLGLAVTFLPPENARHAKRDLPSYFFCVVCVFSRRFALRFEWGGLMQMQALTHCETPLGLAVTFLPPENARHAKRDLPSYFFCFVCVFSRRFALRFEWGGLMQMQALTHCLRIRRAHSETPPLFRATNIYRTTRDVSVRVCRAPLREHF